MNVYHDMLHKFNARDREADARHYRRAHDAQKAALRRKRKLKQD